MICSRAYLNYRRDRTSRHQVDNVNHNQHYLRDVVWISQVREICGAQCHADTVWINMVDFLLFVYLGHHVISFVVDGNSENYKQKHYKLKLFTSASHCIHQRRRCILADLGSVKYDIAVFTGDQSGAGTNANVFLTIYGAMGDSGKRQLQQKGRDLFERKQKDNFQIEAIDLGNVIILTLTSHSQ